MRQLEESSKFCAEAKMFLAVQTLPNCLLNAADISQAKLPYYRTEIEYQVLFLCEQLWCVTYTLT